MYRLIIISILLLQPYIMAEISDKKNDQLRQLYYMAVENEEYIDSLSFYITDNFDENSINNDPLLIAYSGGIESLKAKHAFWPFSKMNYLSDSMEILARAISMDPDNIEIRFMRFSILHYVPGILGYGAELERDLESLVLLLSDDTTDYLPSQLLIGIVSFMIESERLTADQIQLINSRSAVTKK